MVKRNLLLPVYSCVYIAYRNPCQSYNVPVSKCCKHILCKSSKSFPERTNQACLVARFKYSSKRAIFSIVVGEHLCFLCYGDINIFA